MIDFKKIHLAASWSKAQRAGGSKWMKADL